MRQTLVPRNVTRSTKLRGAQRAPELALRSTELCSPENLFFPVLYMTFLVLQERFPFIKYVASVTLDVHFPSATK